MIGTRTPFRVSFIGGGSDLKEFYSITNGCVISTTIDKYMYLFIHQYFDNKIQVKYSKTELVNNISEVKHPIVREVLKRFSVNSIDINSIADVPAGTGLGSSSSYAVGLLHAFYAYKNKYVSSEQLAREACEIEIDILKEPIGKQDQYAAAYGGFNKISFYANGHVDIEPIIMDPEVFEKLQSNLLMFYLGSTRKASDVLYDQKQNILSDKNKFNALSEMKDLTIEIQKCMIDSNLDQFGKLLDYNWQLKKSLSKKISRSDIDDIYELGVKNGAIGGKVLGAGGGGFILFYCEELFHNKLRNALKQLRELSFKFERTGSKIIYVGDTLKE